MIQVKIDSEVFNVYGSYRQHGDTSGFIQVNIGKHCAERCINVQAHWWNNPNDKRPCYTSGELITKL